MNKATRLFLFAGALGWGISVLGVFLPWSILAHGLTDMGMRGGDVDLQVIYWLRMAAGAYAFIGFFFFLAAFRSKYANLIPLLAWASIFEGVVLLVHGIILQRPPLPFWGDAAFCLVIGTGILLSRKKQY